MDPADAPHAPDRDADRTDNGAEYAPAREGGGLSLGPSRRKRRLAGGAALVVVLLGGLWLERATLADHALRDALATLHLQGRYQIDDVSADRLVLSHFVMGDPAHPDLVIDHLTVAAGITSDGPGLSRVVIDGLRLRGQWRDGAMHFGALDPLLSGPSQGPPRLPAFDLEMSDARADLATPAGPVAMTLAGQGRVRDGFVGQLQADAAPVVAGCAGGAARLDVGIVVRNAAPRITGPLRVAPIHCGGMTLAASTLAMDVGLGATLNRGEARLGLAVPGGVSAGVARVGDLSGDARLVLRDGRVAGVWKLAADHADAGAVTAGQLAVNGGLRAGGGDALLVEGGVAGNGITATPMVASRLDGWAKAAASTPLGPVLAAMADATRAQLRDSRLVARFSLRRVDGRLALVVPQATLAARDGTTLLRAERLMLAQGAGGGASGGVLSGALVTGGPRMPQIELRVGGDAGAAPRVHLGMADYAGGGAMLGVPGIDAVPLSGGRGWQIAGSVYASGPLGSGSVSGLSVPINGQWRNAVSRAGAGAGSGSAGTLALWPRCAGISAGALVSGAIRLDHPAVQICPTGGGAAFTLAAGRPTLAAHIPAFVLTGTQGAGGDAVPLRAAMQGVTLMMARGAALTVTLADADMLLGQGDAASHFGAKALTAMLGGAGNGAVTGTIGGGVVALAPVPMDVTALGGKWRYVGGVLTLGEGAFSVADRAPAADARFAPLAAHGASLRLENGVITANADLRTDKDRDVVALALRHDLSSGSGTVDLTLAGLVFDKDTQPSTLSHLALGVVADVKGTVTGSGHIAWANGDVTSHGQFSTIGMDLAAPFGPVKGVAGTITFTDLLGLVTAPHQQVTIASINPGVEVDDGVATFALQPGRALAVEGVEWPFLDGKLHLLPTHMIFGASETRRYELVVEGLDAAKFLNHIGMSNLSATGKFDGSLPLVFVGDTGRIDGGTLVSRAPGGTVAYVGELTYKDLSPMANYAFQTLRSLKYKRMSITMNGPLAGEIITHVGMEGVGQGPQAKRNFLTKQVANLPIRFNVNIRAPFFQMVGSLRSLYDPTAVIDPRTLGLVDAHGKPLAHVDTLANPLASAAPVAASGDAGEPNPGP